MALQQVTELRSTLLSSIPGLAITLVVIYLVYVNFWIPQFSVRGRYWSSQPWLGVQKQLFPRLRAGLFALKNTRTLVLEGHSEYSSSDKAFVLPQFANDPIVVLPPSALHDLLQKTDAEIDPHIVQSEQIAVEYTVGKDVNDSGFLQTMVKRHLTRKLPLMTEDIYTELKLATAAQFGTDDHSWRNIAAYPACMQIVAQAANRVFSGPVLCRDPIFLESSRLYAMSVFGRAAVINLLIPKWLQPILAPLATFPIKKHLRICVDRALPVINSKLKELRQAAEQGTEWDPPNDVLSWMIKEYSQSENPAALDPRFLCRQLLMLNIVAIHTTTMTITNTLLDLYSSPHRDQFVAGLREEIDRVFLKHNKQWSKEAVNQLLKTDSAIKESMRLSNLNHIGMRRLVVDPKGVTFLDDKLHLPAGVRFVVPNVGIHQDGRNYESPHEWDAFRFSRAHEGEVSSQKSAQAILQQKNNGLVTTSNSFLGFGHGRHACPGRFFASQEMKLMLAYIVTNYDVRVNGERPRNMEFGSNSVPSNTAKLEIRLRMKQTT